MRDRSLHVMAVIVLTLVAGLFAAFALQRRQSGGELVGSRDHMLVVGTMSISGTQSTSVSTGAIRVSPRSDGNMYPNKAVITLEAVPPPGHQFGWWVIKESADIAIWEFTTSDPKTTVIMDASKHAVGVFVGKWHRRTRKEPASDILINALAPGQKVRLIDGDRLLEESTVGRGEGEIRFPVSVGLLVSGQFEVSAPDSQTIIFRSPVYPDLKAGDLFGF